MTLLANQKIDPKGGVFSQTVPTGFEPEFFQEQKYYFFVRLRLFWRVFQFSHVRLGTALYRRTGDALTRIMGIEGYTIRISPINFQEYRAIPPEPLQSRPSCVMCVFVCGTIYYKNAKKVMRRKTRSTLEITVLKD